MDLDEYVADADECDQQPMESDKATSPRQNLVSKILQSLAKDQPNWSCQGCK